MSQFIIRFIINAVALWVAAYLLDGIRLTDDVTELVIVALIFGLVNALIRPIVQLATCLINVITLGLFTFIINAFMLMLTGNLVGERLSIDGFWDALLGGIIISIISTFLSMFLVDDD